MDAWNKYKNALRDMLTKPTGTVDMEDGTGNIVTLPTFPQLQKNVTDLTNAATGAVAGAQASASAALAAANEAARSDSAALVSATAAKASEDAAAVSRAAAMSSETHASTSETKAATSEAHAASSESAAASSQVTTKTYMDNAGFSAGSAQASKEAAATSQNLAMQYANAPINVQVQPGYYSAFHWAEQARLNILGSLVFRGKWDASKDAFPTSPKLGDFYLIGTAGTMGGAKYGIGDMLMYDGDAWDRVDNQQVVTSVAGRVGAVTLSTSDISGMQAALDTRAPKENPIFTGTLTVQNGPLRASGWGGTPTDGVAYFGNADSFIFKSGSNFTFKNEQGGFIATLTAGGQMWTANNFNPAAKLDARASLGVTANTVTDWNAADTNGWHMAANAANAPAVDWLMARVSKHNDNWIQQEAWAFTDAAESVRYRRHKLNGTWGPWTSKMRLSGSGDPGQAEYNTALTLGGTFGGGIGFIDGTAQGRIWTTGDGWLHFGTGSTGSSVGERLAISSGGVKIMGGPVLTNEGGVFRVQGQIRSYNRSQTLAVNGAAWVDYPRVFVQGGDPGGMAEDGDLWIW